jgi:membrane-bound lytic murein transglycosylase D
VTTSGRRAGVAIALLALSALATPADEPAVGEPDLFPEFEAIAPNVEFWTSVFSEWTLGQVVIHDLDHPAMVYEIVDLPGPSGGRYTEQQQASVDGLCEFWKDYLRQLERKVSAGEPLEEIDKLWALHFAEVVGSGKLEGAHRRVRSQRGLRESFRAGLERSFRFDRRIREIMREHGVPEDLAYLPHVESSFQYRARSSAGATGIWQFTRGTGKHYLTINSAIDERLDPIAATRGAARFLKDAYEELGTWPLALTAYNHGLHGMKRAKHKFGADYEKIFLEYTGRSFGFASKNFYSEFLAARRVASKPDHYFPEGYTPEPEMDLDRVVLERRATPYWVSNEYGVPLDELAALNPGWSRRAVDSGLRLPAGTVVWLPKGALEGAGHSGASPAADQGGPYHVVRPGDTLSEIARAHGVSLDDLLSRNTLTRQSVIRPGEILHIP